MQMIPSTPHRTPSKAEKRVFDRLRSISSRSIGSFTAYHSLNLTTHAYKRFGEMDFVLCGELGLFVLEVKGGRIACEKGVWQYINRFGESNRSNEGPFKQAETALHGLRSVLRKKNAGMLIDKFPIGYAVIFPDFEWETEGAEWDRHTLADARDMRRFERWLENMVRYWHQKNSRHRQPDVADVKALKSYIRPEFETAMPLHVQTERVEEAIAQLTDDQMKMLDVVDANPRVMCSGGAGTGKTFLAMELANRWAAMGRNVLLACHSEWLKRYLESRFVMPGLSIGLASGIGTVARRAGIEQFDALIVDEGQDLLNWGSLEQIDKHLKGGLDDGKWCFFYDVNNQSGLFGPIDKEALGMLESCHPARVPLTKNCRNTRLILDTVKTLLGADMGVEGVGEGPDVRQTVVDSVEASAMAIEKEISLIIEKGGLSYGELTILSPLPFAKSSVARIDDRLLRHLIVLDAFSFRDFPPDSISYTEIRNFKGLENEAVMVVDLPFPKNTKEPLPQHYVAMSRARAVLSLIFMKQPTEKKG
jgi:hypothetical protein